MSKIPPRRQGAAASSNAEPDRVASQLTPEEALNLRKKVLAGKAARYLNAADQIKPLEEEKSQLSATLKEEAVAIGTKDSTGTFTVETDEFVIKSIAASTTKLDEKKALNILTSKGLIERCTKQFIDSKEIEICFQEGLLDAVQIDQMLIKAPASPRVSVKRK